MHDSIEQIPVGAHQPAFQAHHWPEDMGKSLRKLALICAALGTLGVAAVGCAPDQAFNYETVTHIEQRDNGVWVFPASGYADSIVQFRKEHPELKIISTDINSQIAGGYGRVASHVVLTEPTPERTGE